MSRQQHSEAMQSLIDQHGIDRVYETWMNVHGYPPTWNSPPAEVIRLAGLLKV